MLEGLHEVFMLLLVPPHHLLYLLHPVQSPPHLLIHEFLAIHGQLWERRGGLWVRCFYKHLHCHIFHSLKRKFGKNYLNYTNVIYMALNKIRTIQH